MPSARSKPPSRGSSRGKGTVVLTDMFGGTPSNLSLAFLEKGRVEVVTGVNLPMLIRLASLREEEEGDLRVVAAQAMREAKESVYLASDLLASQERKTRRARVAEKRVQIVNVLGLHARAAARFVRAATRFRSKVTITKDGNTTDGKSILGILFLAASTGTEIVIRASGEDENEAVDTLANLVAGGLGEEDDSPRERERLFTASPPDGRLRDRWCSTGSALRPGIVIARALVFQHQEAPIFRVPLLRAEVASEVLRLEAAKDITSAQLLEIRARTVSRPSARTTVTSSTPTASCSTTRSSPEGSRR